MIVRKFFEFHSQSVIRLSGTVFLCLLFLGVGCAPKVVIQTPASTLPAQTAPSSTVSVILLGQFQAWKGVPHRIGGSDRQGVDCSGLMQAVFRDAFRMDLPRTSREQSRLGQKVDAREMRPGDLVYFIDKGGDHIGVIVENGKFLHSSSTQGVILSELDAYWWPRLKRVQRVLS
jgi:cell wall-associated NlpC family hydrolase